MHSLPRVRRPGVSSMRRRVIAITLATQLPAVLALILAGGPWRLGLAVPAFLTLAFLRAYRGPFAIAPGRGPARAALFGFFVWLVGSLVFAVLAPVGLVLAYAVGLPHVFPTLAGVALTAGVASLRPWPAVRRVTLRFPDLPPALDGLTIAQLSDLHCGPFVPEARVAAWVRRTNALRPDLVALTGDLVASGDAHVKPVARALGGLRAPRGVHACMGNHDYFGAGESLVRALEAEGISVLRNEGRHAGVDLVIAGVDDTWTHRADVPQTLARSPAGFMVLLAHDPQLFGAAAAAGVPLTLSGHTHAGQLAVPFVRRLNLASLVYPRSVGVYREGVSALYVSPGLGTTGPPVRLGARAEIALLTLRRGLP